MESALKGGEGHECLPRRDTGVDGEETALIIIQAYDELKKGQSFKSDMGK